MIPYPTDAQAKADILAAGRKTLPAGAGGRQRRQPLRPGGGKCPLGHPHRGVQGDMTEDMLVKMTLDGTVLEGTRKPSSETKMHLRIYQENPTVRAVVHAHPPVATTFAAAGIPWTSRCSRRRWSNWAPCRWPPLPSPGSQGVADSVAPFCRDYRALLAGIPRRRHLGHQHGADPLPVGVPGTGGHRHPAPAHLGVSPGHPPLTWWRNWRAPPGVGDFIR